MSKEIQMTKPEENRMQRAVLFVILSSSLIRHSSFVIRISAFLFADEQEQEQEHE